jgi:hypothetical protein
VRAHGLADGGEHIDRGDALSEHGVRGELEDNGEDAGFVCQVRASGDNTICIRNATTPYDLA